MTAMSPADAASPAAATTVVRITTRVLAGGRVEVTAPQLHEGDAVEVSVTPVAARHPSSSDNRGHAPPKTAVEAARQRSELPLLEFLAALPPGPRSAATWDEVEERFQRERDSWER